VKEQPAAAMVTLASIGMPKAAPSMVQVPFGSVLHVAPVAVLVPGAVPVVAPVAVVSVVLVSPPQAIASVDRAGRVCRIDSFPVAAWWDAVRSIKPSPWGHLACQGLAWMGNRPTGELACAMECWPSASACW
jgi:hypothetical protein